MKMENLMETNRLEAFYDAIIAIIVTVLVLELPQPETATIAGILALKVSYFTYLVSFLVCANLWQYHHLIYAHVKKIDSKIIWLNILLMFVISLIPYLTIFVANNPNSLLSESLYGLDFILVDIILFIMSRYLIKINEDSEYLSEVLDLKNVIIIPFIFLIIGFIIGFLGYPIAISIVCLITIVRSILYSIK
ncbi:TMEM175 family protein [Methanobrevibacter sp.]|uniref:TMEM175 family protein n=1 Tax=Methanobrevibacter sp. TaxID=66852 RepID=UPI00388D2DF6